MKTLHLTPDVPDCTAVPDADDHENAFTTPSSPLLQSPHNTSSDANKSNPYWHTLSTLSHASTSSLNSSRGLRKT
ncbi:hypothetical protein CHS0354_003292, partial [Potamilus streckersoni]